MAMIKPFRALRPEPSVVSRVASVPYDVVNREEAANLADGNPLSFLRVSRAEIELPDEKDPYAPSIYERARFNLERLTSEAPLIRDSEPSLYVYRLDQGGHVQTGVAGTFSVDEYDSNRILKHERTRKEKEDDRTRHLLALGAQTGPVFLAHRGDPKIQAVVDAAVKAQPLYHWTAADGVKHTLWSVAPERVQELIQGFHALPALYIADGHHRAASASRARAELQKRAGSLRDGPENFFLAVAFAASELRILPYYRVVEDLNGLSHPQFLARVGEVFEIQDNAFPKPDPHTFSMLTQESGKLRWRALAPKEKIPNDPIGALDVSILQARLLAPIFGIQDPRTDQRIDFVGGIRGTTELERLVQSGDAAVAFALAPTRLEELFAVSDSGGIMPPKSTWFEPKLRDGILSHVIA